MGRRTENRRYRLGLSLPWMLAAVLATGCALPPWAVRNPVAMPGVPAIGSKDADARVARPAATVQTVAHQVQALPGRAERLPAIAPPLTDIAPQSDPGAQGEPGAQPLTVSEAIALAFQRQPRLRIYLEGIQQARGLSDVAFAPFLPTVGTGYSVGGYNLNVGGESLGASTLPGFAVLPPGFALPVGLNIQTSYELAELRMQWLICDFGRRLGRYNASKLTVAIQQLQTERAFQTVANEVAISYYHVLRTQALLRVAEESVRRDEETLEDARKLARGGVIEREKVLCAEVQLSESRRLLDNSAEASAIAGASLNLAIGIKRGEPIQVVEPRELPPFFGSLPVYLEVAVAQRKEFDVARRSVQVAQEGSRVAKADFAPRVVGEGAMIDLQQASPQAHADIAVGFIKLEWQLFEGGKRIAQQRIADSKIRETMAQAESVADTIAFQVNETYRRLITAQLGIERFRPAVDQARENYRLVRARAAQGDATPTETIDAETALVRAQQNYLNSIYDYLSAIAKLDYATGTTPTPVTAAVAHPGD